MLARARSSQPNPRPDNRQRGAKDGDDVGDGASKREALKSAAAAAEESGRKLSASALIGSGS